MIAATSIFTQLTARSIKAFINIFTKVRILLAEFVASVANAFVAHLLIDTFMMAQMRITYTFIYVAGLFITKITAIVLTVA